MTKVPVSGKNDSHVDYPEAELHLASIDKIDERNELRRFTVFPATETDFEVLTPYSNLNITV